MLRARPRYLLTAFVLGVMTLLLAGVLAQPGADRRNTSAAYYDAINDAQCFVCHVGQGFRPMDIRFIERFSQLPIGEEIEIRVRVQNPWMHELQQISVAVNTSEAQNVRVRTADTVMDSEEKATVTLSAGGQHHHERFMVEPNAREVYVAARILDDPFGTEFDQDLEQSRLVMEVKNQGGTKQKPVTGDAYAQSLALRGEPLVNAGTGNFTVSVGWESESPVLDEEMDVEILMMVNYTRRQGESVFRLPDDLTLRTDENVDVVIPIVLESSERALLDFRVQATAYWAHGPREAPRDDGLYYRFMTMKVQGGDSIVRVDSTAFGPQPVGPAVDLYNLFTRILGFVAALLIPLSMLTGGIFGKGSRRWLNKVTGGAKKRVLWHSAMSWMILAVASFHFILALIEAKFVWTKGLLWGGLGWALLISLGFTGYYQVRMIKRWNYRVWRHTHLWSAVAVLGFTVVHLLIDGSDLAGVRDALPGWHERLIWP